MFSKPSKSKSIDLDSIKFRYLSRSDETTFFCNDFLIASGNSSTDCSLCTDGKIPNGKFPNIIDGFSKKVTSKADVPRIVISNEHFLYNSSVGNVG